MGGLAACMGICWTEALGRLAQLKATLWFTQGRFVGAKTGQEAKVLTGASS